MRGYGQYCGIAKALEVVGERWTLLILRELVDGPKRYTDLQSGVPGVATDMLALRLKELEGHDVVRRRALPPPAASTVYELTERGRALLPAMNELARWGLGLLGERAGQEFRVQWVGFWLHGLVDLAQMDSPLVVQFEVDGQRTHVRLRPGRFEQVAGPAEDADVVVTADPVTLAELARAPGGATRAIQEGRLRLAGNREAISRMRAVFGLISTRPRHST